MVRGAGLRGTAVALVVAVLLGACAVNDDERPPDLRRTVLDFVAASQAEDGGSYEVPRREERRDVADGVLALTDGERDRARRLLEDRGYRIAGAEGVDVVVPAEVPDGRGWGLYAVRPEGREVAVEVPHPRADLRTEHLGAALAEAVAARHLLVAGARRDQDDRRADVAHEQDSLFALVHARLAVRGVPAVQVHGYAQDSSPGSDVVVSPGAAELSPLVREIADRLEDAGLRTCRAWRDDCGALEGRTNVQGAASEKAGSAFAHLEVSRRVRQDRDRTERLVEAVAGAVRATVPRRD